MAGKPGSGGPVPKRESQRRRRNKSAVPTTKATSTGAMLGPALVGQHSAVGRRWYEALRRSGQAAFFEASDWAQAELVVIAIDTFVKKPSAMMLASINALCTTLLVTEGDRRRLHVELEKAPAPESERDAAITDLAEFRRAR